MSLDEKLKTSSYSNSIKDTTKLSGRDNSSSSADCNMSNQFAKAKYAVKGEDEIQDQTANNYAVIDEFP
jgi:hypothetical protein